MLERRWDREHGEKPMARPKSESPPPPRRSWWQHVTRVSGWGWGLVVIAATILAFFIFWSDVTINPRGRLKDDDLFSTLFTVTNEPSSLLAVGDQAVRAVHRQDRRQSQDRGVESPSNGCGKIFRMSVNDLGSIWFNWVQF